MQNTSLTTNFNTKIFSRQFLFFHGVIFFFTGVQACFAGLFVVKKKKSHPARTKRKSEEIGTYLAITIFLLQ